MTFHFICVHNDWERKDKSSWRTLRSDGDFSEPILRRWAGLNSAPLTWLPNQCLCPLVILSWMSEGMTLADIGVHSICSLRVDLLWVSVYIPPPHSLKRKSSGRFYWWGAWNKCGRRRRIIRWLQLIFSPRFSSGKWSGLQGQPCLTLIEWRALLCDCLWQLKGLSTGCDSR